MDKLETYLANQPDQLTEASSRLRREIAYDRLKDAIQHADLDPGKPLSETRLSQLLGISRTPVREALQQLAQEGLVEVIPGRAVTVAAPSVQSVLDVVHMRLLLEPESVRLAADSLTPTDIDKLNEIIQRMEEACSSGNRVDWSKADTLYHEILTKACPNRMLGEIVVQMRNRTHHLANIDLHTNPARLAECTSEHRVIVDRIESKDSDGAGDAMRHHIEKLRESLFTRLSYS